MSNTTDTSGVQIADTGHDVFISYSTKDAQVAYRLLEVLEQHGLRCWIAPRNIPRGAMWADEIDKAIQEARIFVVIISSNSVESKQVPKEVALAVTSCEGIFPFRIDDTVLQGSFRYYLSDYQFTDATTDQFRQMEELALVICSTLGIKPEPEQAGTAEAEQAGAAEAAQDGTGGKAQAGAAETTQVGIAGTAQAGTAEPAKTVTAKPAANGSVVSNAKASGKPTDFGQKEPAGKPKKGLLIGLVVAAAAVVVIVVVVLGQGGKTSPAASAASSAKTVQTAEQKTAVSAEIEADDSSVTAQEETTGTEEQNISVNSGTNSSAATQVVQSTQGETTLTGHWIPIGYEDRGADMNMKPTEMYICADGTCYNTLEEGLSYVSSEKTGPKFVWVGESELEVPGDDVEATITYEISDTYDDSIKMISNGKSNSEGISQMDISISVGWNSGSDDLPEENPTGLTYDQCYPDNYLTMHMTGTKQESPVKKSDIDTWLVFQREYPLLSEEMEPTLDGVWEDQDGNRYTFYSYEGKMEFYLDSTERSHYTGKEIRHRPADERRVNFFERIQFAYTDFDTDWYAVVAYDGNTLSMLDESWDEVILTRVPDTE